MTFTESVKICVVKYAEFQGRASRPEFWWFTLFTFVGTLACQILSDRLAWAFSVATILPSLSVGARRLHDTDRSGWWQLFWLIPVLGWIVLTVLFAHEGTSSRYGGTAGKADNPF